MNASYCGLVCESCLIHTASFEQDQAKQREMRMSVAEQCNKLYGTNLQATDINDCDGCKAHTGRLFSGCVNCGIRKCATGRNFENCAWCSDYVCGMLEKHFLLDPEARNRLDEIHRQKQSTV